MNVLRLLVLLSWILIVFSDPTQAEGRDRELYFPAYYFFAERRLMIHTIKSLLVKSLDDCEYLCYLDDNCVSLNIKNNENGTHACELNNSTHLEHDADLVNSPVFYYRGAKNFCGKNSTCRHNAICQSGFTNKGYRCLCNPGFQGEHCEKVDLIFTTRGRSGRFGTIQKFTVPKSARYLIKAWGARGGTHSYNYGYQPGTYYGGKGACMEGMFELTEGTVLNIVVGQRGGNSVEVKGGQTTTNTAAQLGLSIEDNAGTGGGGGSFVYTTSNILLLAAGGGGGASSGYNGVNGQTGTNGTSSVGEESSRIRKGGTGGQPGECNTASASYHGGVGAGWSAQGCARSGKEHGERGGSRAQGWTGGRAGSMNSGYNGGPTPGGVGGFGGGGGGSEDNGASGGGGGYSGGGSGTHKCQAGGGGGSYCSGQRCSGVTGGNSNDAGLVKIIEIFP